MSWCVLFLILISHFGRTEPSKILAVFPSPSISHQILFRHITQELAKRGHEVTVITPDPAFPKGQSLENLTEIDIHNETYSKHPRGHLSYAMGRRKHIYAQMLHAYNLVVDLFEKQMKNDEVRNLFGKKFDLIIIEARIRATAVFSSIFKAPIIQMSSSTAMIGFERIVGAPYHPLLYPIHIQQSLYDLSIWEKILEVYLNLWAHNIFVQIERKENEMIQRLFGPNIPPINKLLENVELMFLNVHPIWIDNQPMPPNVIFMGGIHKQPRNDLPKDLQSYLDASSKGVIYVSFGSNVLPSRLMPQKIEIMKKVFSELPYNILWKWDQDEMIGRSNNIKISKWLPQPDILRHRKVILFITQGGQQSTDEAIDAEVPMIGIPMLSDQWYNTEKYTRYKIGVKLEFEELTEEKLKSEINNAIKDDSYRENIKRFKLLINDTPLKPLDTVMWWIEYILRHGSAAHLRSPAANISWMEFFELKLLISLFTVATIAIIAISYFFYVSFCYINCKDITFIKFKIN